MINCSPVYIYRILQRYQLELYQGIKKLQIYDIYVLWIKKLHETIIKNRHDKNGKWSEFMPEERIGKFESEHWTRASITNHDQHIYLTQSWSTHIPHSIMINTYISLNHDQHIYLTQSWSTQNITQSWSTHILQSINHDQHTYLTLCCNTKCDHFELYSLPTHFCQLFTLNRTTSYRHHVVDRLQKLSNRYYFMPYSRASIAVWK